MDIRHPSHPLDAKHYTTERLRQEFLVQKLFSDENKVALTYSHIDRFIVGGVKPTSQSVKLEAHAELRADYFLERRELGIINIGGNGSVEVDGESHSLENKDCLYVGKGKKEVIFKSDDASNPAKYYLCSCPAHTEYPVAKTALKEVEPFHTGSAENCNERRICKMIHNDGIQSCQLVMGMTMFSEGSVWNTIPAHVHGRKNGSVFLF